MREIARKVYHKMRELRGRGIDKLDFQKTYPKLVKSLKKTHGTDRAMELAVGGEFEAVGILEVAILEHFGLQNDSYVIDVGCGSGRLARPLAERLAGAYLGTDVVPELVKHARSIVGRPDWRFEVAHGLCIPERDAAADYVSFFSVFTHLLHEQTYVYLQEAKRVLKPGGRIVFSFLDFSIPDHWAILEANVADLSFHDDPLNMFIGKDAIRAWAEHLGLEILAIQDGDKPFIPLEHPVAFENGTVMEKLGTLTQSVCVLRRPEAH